jgi:hypothetical protein
MVGEGAVVMTLESSRSRASTWTAVVMTGLGREIGSVVAWVGAWVMTAGMIIWSPKGGVPLNGDDDDGPNSSKLKIPKAGA